MNRIKEILSEQDITINELAVRLGISRQALSKQIQGKMLVETAERIADALNVPLWELFVSPYDVNPQKMVAFLHYKGKSHTPSTLQEIMTLLKEWHEEEFHALCQHHSFQHIREQFAANINIQQLMDELCALIDGTCLKKNSKSTDND